MCTRGLKFHGHACYMLMSSIDCCYYYYCHLIVLYYTTVLSLLLSTISHVCFVLEAQSASTTVTGRLSETRHNLCTMSYPPYALFLLRLFSNFYSLEWVLIKLWLLVPSKSPLEISHSSQFKNSFSINIIIFYYLLIIFQLITLLSSYPRRR